MKLVFSGIFIAFLYTASLAQHPLDPLTTEEINEAVKIFSSNPNFPKNALYATLRLNEPPKEEVLSFRTNFSFRREAFAIVYDRQNGKTYEAIADLRSRKLVSWKEVENVQPSVFQSEYERLEKIVKTDVRWQKAIEKRGIKDFSGIKIDGWAVGFLPENLKGRFLRGIAYLKGDAENYYARPIEGLEAIVNMNTEEVVAVIDTGIVPVSREKADLNEKSQKNLREKPKPLVISQPEGTSFIIKGNEIQWQNWRFRYAMTPREGLVLYMISYEDQNRLRPIIYRLSLSEMVVPYGDPSENWRWRVAFDVGEYEIGRSSNPLEPKTDAPENAIFLNAIFADEQGKPYFHERCIGIYERDGGILWKHYDSDEGKNESRRARELVIFFVTTIGNYDYAINYIFKQDASIEIELNLTGIMLAKGVDKTSFHSHIESIGHLVAENILAPHHQHFFNFRLDFDIDGIKNFVSEMNTFPMPFSEENPLLNGFIMRETKLKTEREATRSLEIRQARVWKIANSETKNTLGYNTGYILVPGINAVPYADASSYIIKRAGFIQHHFWVTKFSPTEIYAAGDYPNQNSGGEGLPKFIENNEEILDTDIVAWYSLGVTHVPRPEEWPVMPVSRASFKLVPANFFNRNPAINLPK